MKNGHTAVNEFLEKKERFADFFNGNLYRGEQIVLPEELEIIKGESDILVEDKDLKTKKVKRYRDIVMRWKGEIYLAILACETQSNVHYAMPIRSMVYDGLAYVEQINELWGARNDKKENMSDSEFLSRFRKNDKLVPVITLVFYYGTDKWDGSVDLYGMFPEQFLSQKDIIQKYIPNYWINLVEAESIEDVERFQTDLREIFGMMKCRKDQETLVKYMEEHEAYFRHVDGETYYAIGALLQSKRMLNRTVKREERAELDMCKALEDLYQSGCEEGREEGREEGIALAKKIFKLQREGVTNEEIAAKCNLLVSKVEEILA